MEQIVNDMPLWAWLPVGVFIAFVIFRIIKANTKPKNISKGGGGKGGKGKQVEK